MVAGQHSGAGQTAVPGAAGGVWRHQRERQGQGAARVPVPAVRDLHRGSGQEEPVH